MEILKILKALKNNKQISQQQYRTYKGQVLSGDEVGCLKGLTKKKLIKPERAEELITQYALAYTD